MTSSHKSCVLGIDPGLRCTGWGVVETEGSTLMHVAHGTIAPDTKAVLAVRLATIHQGVTALIEKYTPDLVGVEETFMNETGIQSALKLGQARGAAMAAVAINGTPIAEFAPRRIKQAVVGKGAATKTQVMYMIRSLLPEAGELTADEADALACAICTAHHKPFEEYEVYQQ